MNSISSISLSGMNAAQTQLQTAAHNIANTMTKDFKRQDVVQQSEPNGGVSTNVVTAADQEQSLETDVVRQLQAKNAFLANLTVFRTSNQMMGALLNEQV